MSPSDSAEVFAPNHYVWITFKKMFTVKYFV